MTDQAAYRRHAARADELLRQAAEYPQAIVQTDRDMSEAEAEAIKDRLAKSRITDAVVAPPSLHIDVSATVAAAQVHALLALAAAQERVQPADRPLDDDGCPTCESAFPQRGLIDGRLCTDPWHDLTPTNQP